MTTVVLDTNTVVSAIFWPASIARRCLAGLARRQYRIAATLETFEEYEAVAAQFKARLPQRNSGGALSLAQTQNRLGRACPLGKTPQSRSEG